MERRGDIRVAKTVRAIKGAFGELIAVKPVDRITVTELAAKAEINKGTFYLHYPDIYALYDEAVAETAGKIADSFDPYPLLVRDPEAFVRTFLFAQVGSMRSVLTRGELALLSSGNIRFASHYPRCFIDAFKDRIYAAGALAPGPENDRKLEFLLTGMLSVLVRYPPSAREEACLVPFLASVIRAAFPAAR